MSFLSLNSCMSDEISKDDSEYVVLNNDTIKTNDIVGIYSLGANSKTRNFCFCQIEFRKDGVCEIGGIYPLIGLNVKTYYKIENRQILLKDPETNKWSEPTEIEWLTEELNGNGTVRITR